MLLSTSASRTDQGSLLPVPQPLSASSENGHSAFPALTERSIRRSASVLSTSPLCGRQRNVPLLVVLSSESPFRVITDGENSVLEVDIAPTSVHDFLFPRARRQEELKRDPLLLFCRAEKEFQIVWVIGFHDLLRVLVPDRHILNVVSRFRRSEGSGHSARWRSEDCVG
jgi:hypothetical protein